MPRKGGNRSRQICLDSDRDGQQAKLLTVLGIGGFSATTENDPPSSCTTCPSCTVAAAGSLSARALTVCPQALVPVFRGGRCMVTCCCPCCHPRRGQWDGARPACRRDAPILWPPPACHCSAYVVDHQHHEQGGAGLLHLLLVLRLPDHQLQVTGGWVGPYPVLKHHRTLLDLALLGWRRCYLQPCQHCQFHDHQPAPRHCSATLDLSLLDTFFFAFSGQLQYLADNIVHEYRLLSLLYSKL
jgi:hypothetical protein